MERKSFLLRIDPTLWADLESWAASELRSVNGQIEYLLREAAQKHKGPSMNDDFAEASMSLRKDRVPKASRRK